MAAPSLRRLSSLFSASSSSSVVKPVPKPKPKPKPKHVSKPKTVSKPKPILKPKRASIRAILVSLFQERDPEKMATGFLSAATSSARFRSRHLIYHVAVHHLVRCKRPDLVHFILDSHKNFPMNISQEGFTVRLICLYGKAGMASHAASLYEELPSLNCPRTVMSFNALLTAYAHSKDMDGLAKAFKEIPEKDSSIVPNVCSYNILIGVLCEKSELDEAMNVLDLMEKREIKPDRVTFSTLLNGFYTNKKIEEGDAIWDLMKEKDIEPDVTTFNTKVKGLFLVGKIKEAVLLVEQMKRDGPKPDTSTFYILISEYVNTNNLKKAKNVYTDMVHNKYVPTKRTYNLIIPSLVKEGDIDTALDCCHDALTRSSYIDFEVIQGVVEGLARVSRRDEAEKLVEAGRNNGYPQEKLYVPNEQCEEIDLSL